MSDFKETQHGRNHRVGGSDPIPGLGEGDGLRYDFDNEGDWFYAAANDTTAAGGAPSVGYTDGQGISYGFGFSWQFDTGDSSAPFAITNDGGFVLDTAGFANLTAAGFSVLSGGDFDVTSSDGEVFLLSKVSGGTYPQVFVDADASSNSLFLGANDSFAKLAYLTLDSSVPQALVHVTDGAGGGDVVFTVGHNFDATVGNAYFFQLPIGGTFNVTNHSGSVIFRIDEAGTYHILTGATWIANL